MREIVWQKKEKSRKKDVGMREKCQNKLARREI
jgi:hypothetical protein